MKKFLVFVEDPGVTNMILDFPKLFSSLNAEFQIIANSYAADILSNMASENSGHFRRKLDLSINSDKNEEGLDAFFKDVSLFDLAKLFKSAMDRKPVLSPFELNKDPIKLEKQKEVIFNYFDGDGKLSFNNLISKLKTRLEVIVTFLAILDLVKEGSCVLLQVDVFSDIQLINIKLQS